MDPKPSWLLIDGSSLIFRAFFGVPVASFKAPDGRPVNAVRGSLDRIASLIRDRKPRSLAVATDEDWRPAWRVDALPEYKSHRVVEPVPPLLIPQLPLIERLLRAFGLNVIGKQDYEAEDIIASLASRVEAPIEVYSGDRDLFGIVRDPDLKVLYPEKGGLAEITEAEIERRYGIPGRRYADYAILRGDPSDGLPGLKGVGDKAAAAMVRRYEGILDIVENAGLADAARDYLLRAARVVAPVTDLELPVPKAGLPAQPSDPELLEKMSRELGIASSVSRLASALKEAGR